MKLPSTLLGALYALHATAQNMSFNANNFYKSPFVTIHPVSFPSQNNLSIAGNLFVANNLSSFSTSTPETSHPGIVVGHPMGAVKEQSANLYATKLAEHGFVTLSLDLTFWGGSEGIPRNGVSPDLYTEAFSAAVDYLGTQDIVRVDRERIGGMGICGSGGFMLGAAKVDSRIRAVATASMYDMGAASRDGLRNSQSLSQRKDIIEQASQQRWVEADGGPIEYTGGTPNRLTPNTSAVGAEFFDFYRTRRGEFTPPNTTPNLTTHPTLSSNVKFMNFYPFQDLDSISPRPLLFVSGDRAHSREFSEDAYSSAAQPKDLIWIPGAGHVDLYDRVALIPWERLVGFFGEGLA